MSERLSRFIDRIATIMAMSALVAIVFGTDLPIGIKILTGIAGMAFMYFLVGLTLAVITGAYRGWREATRPQLKVWDQVAVNRKVIPESDPAYRGFLASFGMGTVTAVDGSKITVRPIAHSDVSFQFGRADVARLNHKR